MMKISSLSKFAMALVLAVLVQGCAVLDQFSTRARDFNAAAADARTSIILVNIMRAAYAEPLQFTDVSGVSGQGSLSGGVSASIPFPFRGGATASLAQQVIGATPQVSGAANSTFNVVNLNTAEFYNGIQAPISTQTIAAFLSAGVDPYMLMPLVVAEVEVFERGRKSVLINHARTGPNFRTFYSAMNQLVGVGLTAERVSDRSVVGPTLSAEQAASPAVLGALINAGANQSIAMTPAGDKARFQLTRTDQRFRFCFDNARRHGVNRFDRVDFAQDTPSRKQGRVDLIITETTRPATLLLNKGDYCGASQADRALQSGDLTFRITTRSVEGIFHYLGEMVRLQLGLEGMLPEDTAIPLGRNRPTFEMFKVVRGSSANGASIGFTYRGENYSLLVDPTGQSDKSSRVLQFLSSAIALQSSAKDRPAPNVITVLGP